MTRTSLTRREFMIAGTAGAALASTVGTGALAQQPKRGGVLRVATSEEPFAPAFDLHRIRSLLTTRIGYQAYNGLVNVDASRKIEPDLAESWEQPDATTYVFRLRRGVAFHDGTELDAEAVKLNLERLADAATASPKRADFTVIDKIDVLDKHSLRIHLKHPFAPMLGVLRRSYFSVISPKAIKEHMAQDPFKASVGTGPFRFVSYSRGDKVVLERFKDHWRGLAHLDGIEVRIMPEQSTQLAALQTGGLDFMMQTSPTFADQIRNNGDLQLLTTPSTIYDYLAFNTAKAPFDNKLVRQAFSMAIDREGIAQGVYRGQASPAQGAISPAFGAFYRDNADIPFQKYDPDRAKALLKQEDFPFGTELRFDTFTERPWGLVGDAIAAQITALGVKLKIQKPDFNSFAKYFYGTKEYWFGNSAWSAGAVDPDGMMYKQFVTGETQNLGAYSNPQVDELLKQARIEQSTERRADIYNRVNRILMEECYVAFLVHPRLIEGMRKNVQGYRFRDEGAGPYDEAWLA